MKRLELSFASRYRSILWPSQSQAFLHEVILILAGCILLTVASQITLPLKPVPITFQSFAVLLIGMTYGCKRGVYTVIAYLFLGAMGLPVFQDFSSGFSGPTTGYLLGFIAAAGLTGYLCQCGWSKKPISVIFAGILGALAIFFFGIPVLAFYVGWNHVLQLGVLPFIPGEIVKIGMLTSLIPWFWRNRKIKK